MGELLPCGEWPDHVQVVLIAIGHAMGTRRLHPDQLTVLPRDLDAILPDHTVSVTHLPHQYAIEINGPRYAGRWLFKSGDLEKLARQALAL